MLKKKKEKKKKKKEIRKKEKKHKEKGRRSLNFYLSYNHEFTNNKYYYNKLCSNNNFSIYNYTNFEKN